MKIATQVGRPLGSKKRITKGLVEGISSGIELNTTEWAVSLGTSKRGIQDALSGLRKKNHLFYPIGTIGGFKPKEGIIVDIRNSREDVAETMERHNQNYLAPQLVSIVRIIEQTVHKFPQLKPLAMKLMSDSMNKLKEGNNGNTRISNQ